MRLYTGHELGRESVKRHPKMAHGRLGHATIGTTLDTHSHATPGLQAAASLAFDQVLDAGNQMEAQKQEASDRPHWQTISKRKTPG